jgi:hypothetical protein
MRALQRRHQGPQHLLSHFAPHLWTARWVGLRVCHVPAAMLCADALWLPDCFRLGVLCCGGDCWVSWVEGLCRVRVGCVAAMLCADALRITHCIRLRLWFFLGVGGGVLPGIYYKEKLLPLDGAFV